MQLLRRLLTFLLMGASLGAVAQMPRGEYLEAKGSKTAVILAHGRGGSADGNVVGPLRRAIHKDLGFHTLSLEMPDPGVDSPADPALAAAFPEAYMRIQSAIEFLKKEKGVERIYLMGYSMGGRMTSAFLANHSDAAVVGYIGVGLLAGGQDPVNTTLNLKTAKIPVIDVYAENDRDAQFAAFRKSFVSERFVQVPIPGAKHDYRGYDKQVADAVVEWLRKQESK
jgi:pimeloyl-ACP methyl ester carboxylesterase